MKSYNRMVTIIVIAIILTIIANIYILLRLSNSLKELKDGYLQEANIKEVEENKDKNQGSYINESNDIEKEIKKETEKKKESNTETQDKVIESNQEKVIGTVKIPKINFEGEIYEGTSLEVLEKGVGHFDNSPYLDGNVCLAAHNTSKFWAKLKTLKKGDSITYESFLGTREYKVSEITQIEETDWTKIENTDENMLTLITCVKGNKPMRLCVRATEI